MLTVMIDECLESKSIFALFEGLGWQVVRTSEALGQGQPDVCVYGHVRATGCVFVTIDQGFANTRKYPPNGTGGIIVLKTRRSSHKTACDLLRMLIDNVSLASLRDTTAIVSTGSIRLRNSDGQETLLQPRIGSGREGFPVAP